jgi:hypothetical protein
MGRRPFASLLFLLAANGQGGPIKLTLRPSPANYSGSCPATVRFTGTITAAGVSQLQYRVVRSDGIRGPVTTVNFPPSGGMHAVAGTWRLTQDLKGWESIEVLTPVKITSSPAAFSATCKTGAASIAKPAQPGP